MAHVYLGLGSNIDPEKNLPEAAALLRNRWPEIRFSSVFLTKAQEVENQADFLNAVAFLETEESVEDVIVTLIEIERSLGKAPIFRFGPRTIDLDVLLYDNAVIESPTLIVPHPRMHQRRFVLAPLVELIDPSHTHPLLKKTWSELLDSVKDQQVEPASISL
jgi:2-amino-4-hydroxy-6-hydroxymethyldihydropteridine diphosphokinase